MTHLPTLQPRDIRPDPLRGDAVPLAVSTHRLDNGMDVIVIPDRRSPIVTHMVWYRNGAAEDPVGQSGIAHFLEHLMFKGTERHPARHFSDRLAAIGGQENAFTSYDFTAFFQRVPAPYLAMCMEYEADRMTNLVLEDAVVASERDVVLAERGMMCEANPAGLLDEAVQAAAFPAHPCGRPVIGWRHEIEGLGRSEALAYYRRYYTPSNAILIVAGDADPEAVFDMAARIYGAIDATVTAPVRKRVQDPPARTHRAITLRDDQVRQPILQRLHAVPSAHTGAPGESEALQVLAFLLGGDETSLLHERLVRGLGCATGVHVSYWGTAYDQASFHISGTPAAGISPEVLDHSIDEVLLGLRSGGFGAEDIERAKTQIVARALYARDSQAQLAQWYGMSLCCGLSIADLDAWQRTVEAVTPEALGNALRMLDRQTGVSGYLLEAA
ncbi:pitrilysin family protein [Methylobacterium sp. 77]|uniref:M16 family metallopeptidase n=1 Tax=Methylobacterium sp. 77 TaxID=1101192 RepID=UPI00039EA7B5|nr:pitrilysin family protein [Methylobacterium sp. 77]